MTSLPHTARRAIAGAAMACAAALAAGCASSSSTPPTTPASPTTAAGSTSSASSVSTPGTEASPSASGGSSSPTGSPTTAAGVPPCATTALKVTTGAGQGTAGSTYVALDFKNISGAACTLYGYPGVALAGGTPVKQIGAAAVRNRASSPRLVTLAAGETGNAVLQITDARNYPASDCGPVASNYIQVYPPNQFTKVYVTFASTACTKQTKILMIGVVQPGAGSGG
jgi:hypothetical protein